MAVSRYVAIDLYIPLIHDINKKIWYNEEKCMRKGKPVINLTRNRLSVLCHLAVNGPTHNIYQISEELNLRYSAVHASIAYLEKNRLIKLEKEVESEKGGTAKIYGLTLPGLAVVIEYNKIEDFDLIAEKWKSLLPPVLGKWEYFKSMGLVDEREKLLRYIARSIMRDFMLYCGRESDWNQTLEYFVDYVFCQPPEIMQKWCEAIRKNDELKQWIIDELVFRLYEERDSIIYYAQKLWMVVEGKSELENHNPKDISIDHIFEEINLKLDYTLPRVISYLSGEHPISKRHIKILGNNRYAQEKQ